MFWAGVVGKHIVDAFDVGVMWAAGVLARARRVSVVGVWATGVWQPATGMAGGAAGGGDEGSIVSPRL